MDAPFAPYEGTKVWYESPGADIGNDIELAVLMIRLGIASNALASHQLAGVKAIEHGQASRMRGLVNSMITAAAYTFEAIQLGRENLQMLRPLAQQVNIEPAVLEEFGRLGSGKHPVAATLARARNQLGFHWDLDVIRASVLEYTRNESVIWLEFDDEFQPLHRLAHEVIAHALAPVGIDALITQDAQAARDKLNEHLGLIGQAMNTVMAFFAACIAGYFELRRSSVVRKEA